MMMSGWVLCTRFLSSVSGWVVICLQWLVVLSVLGDVVTVCVGVCMVHLQSGLYYLAVLSVCNSDEPSVCGYI